MSPFKMPPQVGRLVLMALAILVFYGVARTLLKPRTFGEYGWFRGAALAETAARKPVFAGAKSCDECHPDVLQKLAKYEHKTISCESCHGPSREHADNPDIKAPKEKFEDGDCLRCHQLNPSRPAWLKQVDPAEHYRVDHCTGCHEPHQPKEAPP
jgi:hypothetical protein